VYKDLIARRLSGQKFIHTKNSKKLYDDDS
jgi:hypothetical protein